MFRLLVLLQHFLWLPSTPFRVYSPIHTTSEVKYCSCVAPHACMHGLPDETLCGTPREMGIALSLNAMRLLTKASIGGQDKRRTRRACVLAHTHDELEGNSDSMDTKESNRGEVVWYSVNRPGLLYV